jgi:hypothetical protein
MLKGGGVWRQCWHCIKHPGAAHMAAAACRSHQQSTATHGKLRSWLNQGHKPTGSKAGNLMYVCLAPGSHRHAGCVMCGSAASLIVKTVQHTQAQLVLLICELTLHGCCLRRRVCCLTIRCCRWVASTKMRCASAAAGMLSSATAGVHIIATHNSLPGFVGSPSSSAAMICLLAALHAIASR